MADKTKPVTFYGDSGENRPSAPLEPAPEPVFNYSEVSFIERTTIALMSANAEWTSANAVALSYKALLELNKLAERVSGEAAE